MKQYLFSFLFFLGLLSKTLAQECTSYYLLTKGANVEISLYDDKQKLSGRQEWTVRDVGINAKQTLATAAVVMYNGEGRELARADDITIQCADGQYSIDMRSLMMNGAPTGPAASGKSESAMALYPSSLQVGMTLPEANFTVDTSPAGFGIRVKMAIKDRKVEGQETITTPVGKFNCYRIAYTYQMKAGIGVSYDGIEWFSPGVGVIKSESYRKGKLIGSSVLTKFTKGKV